MKRIFMALLCTTGLAKANAQQMWQVKKDTVIKWNYAFGDEFNETALDESRWRGCLPWGCAQLYAENVFRRENIEMSGTTMKMYTKKENYKYKLYDWEIDSSYLKKSKIAFTNPYEFHYTGAEISSLRKFKYGYFEIRFKSPGAYGIWPAFWLFGGEPNEEIDIFELKGERDDQIHIDAHCPDGCDNFKYGFLKLKNNWGGWVKTDAKLSENWNIISGEWQKDYVKWFLNGEPIAYFKKEYKTEQFLILGTGPAQTGYAFSPGPNQTTPWPNIFEVDYVRVWSQKDTLLQQPNTTQFKKTKETMQGDAYKAHLKKKLSFAYDNKVLSAELGMVTLLPLTEKSYSLTFAGRDPKNAKLELLDENNKKVKETDAGNAKYMVLNLADQKNGKYALVINVWGKKITAPLTLN